MRDGSCFGFSPPKGAKGRRTIRLTAGASEVLRRHHGRQAEEKQGVRPPYQGQGLIFATGVGTPLNAPNVAGRISKGMNPKIAQEHLGHTTISLTMDVYSHVMPDMQD